MPNVVDIFVENTVEPLDVRRIKSEFNEIERFATKSADGVTRAFQDSTRDSTRWFDRFQDDTTRVFAKIESDSHSASSKMESDFGGFGSRLRESLAGAGGALSGGLQDGIGGIDVGGLGNSVSSLFGSAAFLGPVAAVLGGVGLAFGGDLMEGIADGVGSRQRVVLDSLRTGMDLGQIRSLGEEGGELFSRGFGQGLTEMRNLIVQVEHELRDLPLGVDSDEIARRLSTMNEVFGLEINETLLLARKLVQQGLAGSVAEAIDIIATGVQEAGIEADEFMDVMKEFSPFFSKLGIEGATSINFISEAIRTGLFPMADRAGEVFEEFLNRMANTDDAKDAITELGLGFDDLQSRINKGFGEQVFAEVTSALADMEDQTLANKLAVEIYGTAMEGVNIQAVNGLFESSRAAKNTQVSVEEMANAVEASRTEFDVLKRSVANGAASMGRALDSTIIRGLNMAVQANKEAVRNLGILKALVVGIPGVDIPIRLPGLDAARRALNGLKDLAANIGIGSGSGGGGGGRGFGDQKKGRRAPPKGRGRFTGRAEGGLNTGEMLVGENGPELVDFGARTARVTNAGATANRLAGAGGGGGPQTVNHFHIAGAVITERELEDMISEVVARSGAFGGLSSV